MLTGVLTKNVNCRDPLPIESVTMRLGRYEPDCVALMLAVALVGVHVSGVMTTFDDEGIQSHVGVVPVTPLMLAVTRTVVLGNTEACPVPIESMTGPVTTMTVTDRVFVLFPLSRTVRVIVKLPVTFSAGVNVATALVVPVRVAPVAGDMLH